MTMQWLKLAAGELENTFAEGNMLSILQSSSVEYLILSKTVLESGV